MRPWLVGGDCGGVGGSGVIYGETLYVAVG